MLATQTMPTQLNTMLDRSATNLQYQVNDVMHSGQYYVTPEVCRELKHINNGVSHIKLDQNFVDSSREFARKFDPSAIANERIGASHAMEQASGTMDEVKGRMDATSFPNYTDNKVRASHDWAMGTLGGVEKDIGPYAHRSIDRVKQYCDHMGVTDRYTGYRHNLNRGRRDPVRLNYQWLDTQPNEYNSTLNTGWGPAGGAAARAGGGATRASCPAGLGSSRAMSAPAAPQMHYATRTGGPCHEGLVNPPTPSNQIQQERGPFNKSIQEQCGINTTFPGKTEYMTRYKKPNKDEPVSSFIVNPTPDYTRTGRPLMKLCWDRGNTEYQTRYLWPDGSTIEKLPWLRK